MKVTASAGRAAILSGALAILLLPTACQRSAPPHVVAVAQSPASAPAPVETPPAASGKFEFVGCAGPGQQGPRLPPAAPRVLPEYPPEIGAQLAYYASDKLAAVAPRGWHCIAGSNSAGDALLITPEVQAAQDIFGASKKISGPAVFASRSYSATDGRLEVARIAAQAFPIAKKFVKSVTVKSPEIRGGIHYGSSPGDTINRSSDTDVEFETAANSDGLGTAERLEKDGQPIVGAAMLSGDMDLFKIDIRLPSQDKNLVPAVMQAFEGSPIPRL
jgi:hypothetical protein